MGFDVSPDTIGIFGQGTVAAVETFQYRRGLNITGICTQLTWDTLVEACYKLGDRILYFTRPVMKGDDVAELQRRLSALGFDIGKVDGMFGKETANGLAEFQSNVGIHADSVCGYRTVAELARVLLRHSGTELVASVKDRERLRHRPKTLAGTTVFITEGGGLGALVSALKRGISGTSATVLDITHPNESVQASAANTVGADVCLALLLRGPADRASGLSVPQPSHRCVGGVVHAPWHALPPPPSAACLDERLAFPEPLSAGPLTDSLSGSIISYYAGHTYESPGGKRLAELAGQYLKDSLGIDDITIKGMSVPILRETKMPCVLCQIGPPSYVVKFTSVFASALARALTDWAICPVDD